MARDLKPFEFGASSANTLGLHDTTVSSESASVREMMFSPWGSALSTKMSTAGE